MQDKSLEKVQQFYRRRNRMPTYKEMRKLFNNPPCTAVAFKIYAWKRDGIIKEEDNGLTPSSKFFGLPLLGNIKAGFPTMEDGYQQSMSLHDYMFDNPKTSYLLQISNGNLVSAGIQSGDIVIVDTQKQPNSGDIVAIQHGSEWQIKFYDETMQRYSPERFSFRMGKKSEIFGVISGVIRKTHS